MVFVRRSRRVSLLKMPFFDHEVSFEEKRKMVEKLQSKKPVVNLKDNRSYSNLSEFKNCSLSDFVSEKTLNFFNQFGWSTAFLQFDVSNWESSFEFEEAWTFCRDLFVVNDTAERGVKFIKDFNKVLTNDEDEKQCLNSFDSVKKLDFFAKLNA